MCEPHGQVFALQAGGRLIRRAWPLRDRPLRPMERVLSERPLQLTSALLRLPCIEEPRREAAGARGRGGGLVVLA
eukprot:7359894-Prymnesium_polylepis.1